MAVRGEKDDQVYSKYIKMKRKRREILTEGYEKRLRVGLVDEAQWWQKTHVRIVCARDMVSRRRYCVHVIRSRKFRTSDFDILI